MPCIKCGGGVFPVEDQWGKYLTCANCGKEEMVDMKNPNNSPWFYTMAASVPLTIFDRIPSAHTDGYGKVRTKPGNGA